MHDACNTDLAHHTTHRTKPAPDPHQSALRRMRHFCSTGLQPQCLVELQSRIGSASISALCNNRSCPASALRFAVWSNSCSRC